MTTSVPDRDRTASLSPLLALALAGLAAVASGCLTVEAEIPEVEITQRGIMFKGVPPIAESDVSMTTSYSQDHGKLDLPSGFSTEVKTLGVTLTATGGVDDLSFIHYLRITMSAEGDETAFQDPIEIGLYEPAAGTTVGDRISLATLNPIDVLDAWQTESATFTLEIAGTLPAHDWTGDVTVRFAGTAKYSY